MTEPNKYAELLANWDVNTEQNRADFLEWLYEFYGRTNCLYTGLYQQFIEQLSNGLLHDLYSARPELFRTLRAELK